MNLLEQEPASTSAETNDRHTKKVKIKGSQNGCDNDEIMDQGGEDMDVQMDNMDALEPNTERAKGVSFKDMLMGKDRKDMKQKKPAVEIELQEHDVLFVNVLFVNENDMPTIKFSDRVKSLLAQSMGCSVIVKLLGKSIGHKTLQSRLLSLWKLLGEFQIVDMDNGYFLINLEDQEDYINALTKGPWTILGHYLTVQPWSSNFNLEENFPAEIVVWIRLPNMPLQYYH